MESSRENDARKYRPSRFDVEIESDRAIRLHIDRSLHLD
jgi:hypothetical protein